MWCVNKNQLQFFVGKERIVGLKNGGKSVLLTTEEQQWNADILRALNVVNKNYSI